MTAQRNKQTFVGAVEESDFELLEKGFDCIDFRALKSEVEQLSCFTPRLTDFVLIRSVYLLAHSEKTEGVSSIGFLPFVGVNPTDQQLIRLPVMDDIVNHFEESPLASDMWLCINLYLRRNNRFEIRFVRESGCAAVPNKALHDGSWRLFLKEYNERIRGSTGRTDIVRRRSNILTNASITEAQLAMWESIRGLLFSAPSRTSTFSATHVANESLSSR